jgi:hypothetical protein
VTNVELVSTDEAVRRFRSIGREDLADLYLLAAATKRLSKSR